MIRTSGKDRELRLLAEYIKHWGTEVVYFLFLITVLIIILVFQLQKIEGEVLFSVFQYDVTIFQVSIFIVVVIFGLLINNQLKRRRIEEELNVFKWKGSK